MGFVLLTFLVFYVVLLCVFTILFRVEISVTISAFPVRLYTPLFVGELMSYCGFFVYSDVQHFAVAHLDLPLRFSLTFIG
jgi:hypothetical protein